MADPLKPPSFVRDLHNYDAALRLRWGVHQAVWIIERKMEPRHKRYLAEQPNPFKNPRGLDLAEGWRQGYVHVMNVHPDLLSWATVVPHLANADLWRHGSTEAMNRACDEAEAAEERAADQQVDDYVSSAARDAADRFAWLGKRRISVPEDVA